MSNKTSSSKIGRAYALAGILLFAVCLANGLLLNIIYVNSRNLYNRNMESIQHMSTINDELSNVNENVLLVVSQLFIDAGVDPLAEIQNSFNVIREEEKAFEETEGHTAIEERRYNQAKLAIESYDQILLEQIPLYENGDFSTARSIYVQEVIPLQNCATEMLMATIEIGSRNAADSLYQNAMFHGIGQLILIGLFLLGEAAIFFASSRAKKANAEIEQKQDQLVAAGKRLEHSQKRVQDIANTNILTGLRNRYALETDISDRLETDQFNIGVFDLDNFRSINDTYGYEFGDEYLAQMADRLKDTYGSIADIYNITGNEFCFVFHSDVPDVQAQNTAEKIRATMSETYDILGTGIQLSASGSIYHYLPNDSLNINALLVKLDTTMRQAKMSGGGKVYAVTSI